MKKMRIMRCEGGGGGVMKREIGRAERWERKRRERKIRN